MLIIPQVRDLGESITVTSCRMGAGQLWRCGIHSSSRTSSIMAFMEDAQVSCIYSTLISFFIASIAGKDSVLFMVLKNILVHKLVLEWGGEMRKFTSRTLKVTDWEHTVHWCYSLLLKSHRNLSGTTQINHTVRLGTRKGFSFRLDWRVVFSLSSLMWGNSTFLDNP